MRGSRGFTILELLIVLLIVVIMAGMAIDMFGGNRYERVDAGVSLLEADMGYARSLAIGSPSDPVLVRIAVDGTGYHVAEADGHHLRAYGHSQLRQSRVIGGEPARP